MCTMEEAAGTISSVTKMEDVLNPSAEEEHSLMLKQMNAPSKCSFNGVPKRSNPLIYVEMDFISPFAMVNTLLCD